MPSNGLHSNGFSLIRRVIKKKKIKLKQNRFLRKELLKPTKIYVKEILNLVNRNLINGCANITGGGIEDNIKRIIPKGLVADIDLKKIKIPKIFKWLSKSGVTDKEMLKTFNCGVGFCLVAKRKNISRIKRFFKKKYQPYVIGKIMRGDSLIKLNEKIVWK